MSMDSDEAGIYEDTGTNGQQPTNEQQQPGGSGVFSKSSAGPNKRDPMSSGPTLGNTIAGRSTDTEANTSDTNANTAGEPDLG